MNFSLERRSSVIISSISTFTVPHRPVPPIPGQKSSNVNENKQTIDNIYLVANEVPHSLSQEEETSFEDKVKGREKKGKF